MTIKRLLAQVWRGGMPGIFDLSDDMLPETFGSHVRTYVERDVRQLANVEDQHLFSRFPSLCATLSGQEINHSELVLSGPDLRGIPTRDTAAVMHTLIENARREIVLVGYAIHNGKLLFARLAERMADDPSLTVALYLNIERPRDDTSLASEIARRFAHDFRARHWPWDELPEFYYDARSLAEDADQRTGLRAKCIITDRESALVTSANFTKAAQQRNIEVGVLN